MSPKIGVVGAGPGGLSLARLLTDKGFADVTVLERADRVGGKSLTVPHQGIGHELGTCYVALGYTTVKRWMEQAGIGFYLLERQKILAAGGELLDFKAFVEGPAGLVGSVLQVAGYTRDWLAFHDWDLRAPSPSATTSCAGASSSPRSWTPRAGSGTRTPGAPRPRCRTPRRSPAGG